MNSETTKFTKPFPMARNRKNSQRRQLQNWKKKKQIIIIILNVIYSSATCATLLNDGSKLSN
jgi:hypothetical protein